MVCVDSAFSPMAIKKSALTPFFGCAISIPKYAVGPLMPSVPRNTVSDTNGIFGTFWKDCFAEESTTT